MLTANAMRVIRALWPSLWGLDADVSTSHGPTVTSQSSVLPLTNYSLIGSNVGARDTRVSVR